MSWTTLYQQIRTQWVTERGAGPSGRTGAVLPRMHATDGVTLLAHVTDEFLRALAKANDEDVAKIGSDDAANRRWFDAIQRVRTAADRPDLTKDLRTWLAMGKFRSGSRRSVRWFEQQIGPMKGGVPYHLGGRLGGTAEVDNLVGKWDRLIQLIAGHVASGVRFPHVPDDQVVEFWSAYYQLLIAMEVVIEVPDPSLSERLKGAIKHAARETLTFVEDAAEAGGELAGRGLAAGAKIVGKAAGGGIAGFFAEAGMTAILVVALGVYVYLR